MPDPIIFQAGQTSLNCYVRFDDASNTAVNLTAGSGLKATRYTATASALVTAGLAAGTYYPSVFAGTAASQATSNQLLADLNAFHWSGTLEIPSWAKIVATRFGYNNVLEVGSGQPYSTIASATTAASAGDLVVIHRGTYAESDIGKNGVTYWFAHGATVDIGIQDAGIFNASVTDLRVLGCGKFVAGIDGRLYHGTTANCDATIECDWLSLTGTNNSQITSTQTTGRVAVRARRINVAGTLAVASAGRIGVHAERIEASGLLASTSSSGLIMLAAENAVCSAASPFGGSGGVIAFRGRLECTHASATGLNAPSGVTVIADAGAIKAPDGRPTFSGTGQHLTSPALAVRN